MYVYVPFAATTIVPPCAVVNVPTLPASRLTVGPSTSVSFDTSDTVPVSTVSSSVLAASSAATGASFVPVIVTVTNCDDPSVATNV